MKLFTCVTQESLSTYVDHLRVTINSALTFGRVEPHVLFDGDPGALYKAVGHEQFVVHERQSSIVAEIRACENVPGWSRRDAEGALLRFEILQIEQNDPFVLYTDCDVVFSGRVDLDGVKPRFIAAAPGHNPNHWADICSGVMILNVAALRSEYDGLMRLAVETLGQPHFYDQEVINAYFRDRIDRLPLEYHWKTYWGANPRARIVHFHGPKRAQIAALLDRAPEAEIYEQWYRPLWMQPDGLAHYARLFDALNRAPPPGHGAALGLRAECWRGWFRNRARGALRRLSAGRPDPAFPEAYYLYLNPDIAIAVRERFIPSGAWHYERFGRAEGRATALPAA